VTVCPSRLLAEAQWAEEFLEWWIWSVRWDGMTGQPTSAPRWPFPGGLLRQPRRLVDACKLLRAEWPYVRRPGATRTQGRTGSAPEAPGAKA
jgi:hypothetical protein